MNRAKLLKPSGRLTVDDIKKAEKFRKTTSLSEQRNRIKFNKVLSKISKAKR